MVSDFQNRSKEISFNKNFRNNTQFSTDYFPGQVKYYWVQVGPTNTKVEFYLKTKLLLTESTERPTGSISHVHVYYGVRIYFLCLMCINFNNAVPK